MTIEAQKLSALPKGPEDINAGLLTEMFAAVHPGVVVTSAAIGTIIHGTATKLHLLLTYNEVGRLQRLPPSLWLKTGFEAHSTVSEIAAIYRSEAYFYRDVAADLKIGCPKAYVAHIEPGDVASFFLLEDLLARNAEFGRATKPISLDQARQILDVLARLHARYWRRKAEAPDWLSDGLALDRIQQDVYVPEVWDRCIALPRGRFVPESMRNRELLRDAVLNALRYDREHAMCMVHGDAHIGNTYFDLEGQAGYLDWQTVMWGHWAHDVGYFVSSCTSIEDRRHGERDLIHHYLTELARAGAAAPSFEDAWLEYRRHVVYNLGWAFCIPEWQPEDVCSATADRAFAAALDLDSIGAWR